MRVERSPRQIPPLKQNSVLPVGTILPIAAILGIENGRSNYSGHNADRIRSGLFRVLAARPAMVVGRFGKERGRPDKRSCRAVGIGFDWRILLVASRSPLHSPTCLTVTTSSPRHGVRSAHSHMMLESSLPPQNWLRSAHFMNASYDRIIATVQHWLRLVHSRLSVDSRLLSFSSVSMASFGQFAVLNLRPHFFSTRTRPTPGAPCAQYAQSVQQTSCR
jgi:hypothetical protein